MLPWITVLLWFKSGTLVSASRIMLLCCVKFVQRIFETGISKRDAIVAFTFFCQQDLELFSLPFPPCFFLPGHLNVIRRGKTPTRGCGIRIGLTGKVGTVETVFLRDKAAFPFRRFVDVIVGANRYGYRTVTKVCHGAAIATLAVGIKTGIFHMNLGPQRCNHVSRFLRQNEQKRETGEQQPLGHKRLSCQIISLT